MRKPTAAGAQRPRQQRPIRQRNRQQRSPRQSWPLLPHRLRPVPRILVVHIDESVRTRAQYANEVRSASDALGCQLGGAERGFAARGHKATAAASTRQATANGRWRLIRSKRPALNSSGAKTIAHDGVRRTARMGSPLLMRASVRLDALSRLVAAGAALRARGVVLSSKPNAPCWKQAPTIAEFMMPGANHLRKVQLWLFRKNTK